MLPEPGDVVCAGLDMGLRADSSALVIVHARANVLRVAEIVEMRPRPDAPLKPSDVVRTFAERMRAHRCPYAVGDSHYREAVVEYLSEYGLSFADGPTPPAIAYVRARALFRAGRVKLPKHQRLLQQLREVQGRPMAGGGMSISQKRWAQGGHGDIVSALVLALYQLSGEEIPKPAPAKGTAEWIEAARERRRQKLIAEQERPAWMPRGRPVDRGPTASWRR